MVLLMATWNWIGFAILGIIAFFVVKTFFFGDTEED